MAGDVNKLDYWRINVDGRRYLAHRLAFMWMEGRWPREQIDHKNRNKADNRWCNLREATPSQNLANSATLKRNTSGMKGVVWHKRGRKWSSQIGVGGATHYLGLFDCPAAAAFAYIVAADKHFGEFARAA